MAKLDKETLKTLTELSCIECTDDECEALLKDLQGILNYFEQLEEVDTEHVPPCNHVLDDIASVMRKDIPGDTMPRDVFLANAPSQKGGLVIVPPVIKST